MRNHIFLVTALLLGSPALLWGQSPAPPPSADPSEDVADRMNRLEAETQSFADEVQWLREHPARLPAVEATPTGMAPTPAAAADPAAGRGDYFTLDELRGEMKKLAWTKGDFSIVPYGYLWGNTVYSTERTSPGSYTLFVLSPSGSRAAKNECIVDVRNTRLGFDVLGPPIPFFDCAKGGGKVEIDFQSPLNTTAGENKATVMLRHAYAEVKDDDFRFLAGQTWDVISPLESRHVDVLGRLGRRQHRLPPGTVPRRTVFRLLRRLAGHRATLDQPASVRRQRWNHDAVGHADGRTVQLADRRGTSRLDGRASRQGLPPITVGLSGHIGEQEFIYSIGKLDEHRRTWSGNVDVRVPLTERLGVQGECYIGENLGTFLGGIGQGIDPYTLNTIRDAGGWVEVWYDWTPRLHSHVGYSVDDPNDHDFAHYTGGKIYNQFYFGNLTYDLTKNFLVGMEVSSWKTLYFGQLPGDSVRCEFVAKYGF